MKISVVTSQFSMSGVPLAQIRFARALAKRGHDVDLLIGCVAPDCRIPDVDGVNVRVLEKSQAREMLFPMYRYLRVVRPHVVFSAEDHLNVIVLLAAILSRSKAKISGSSRILPTDPMAYSNKPLAKGWFLKQLMKAVMWRADALTCVSRDMVDHYHQVFRSPPHVCVYNIISDSNSHIRMEEPIDHDWLLNKQAPVIVTAGTMSTRKGFADLVQAMGILSKKRFARLIILGDGVLRGEIETQVETLGLTDIVSMPGNVTNPLKYFYHADVFVLSSYAEGMPNVLVEAMACGCTPVSTDCPTGPRELLLDGKYGYLVPMKDPVAMAAAIDQALHNPIPKDLLAEAVRPFDEDSVIRRHFDVLALREY